MKREKALAAAGTEADERTAALAARQVAVQAAEAAASSKAEALAEAQQKLSAEREAHAQREQELSTAESEVCMLHVQPPHKPEAMHMHRTSHVAAKTSLVEMVGSVGGALCVHVCSVLSWRKERNVPRLVFVQISYQQLSVNVGATRSQGA